MSYDFDWSVIGISLPFLWQGMKFTLLLLLWSLVGGIVWGTCLALMRLSSVRWLSLLASVYVDVFRSIPLVLAIFWFYFLVPLIIQAFTGRASPIGPYYSAFVAYVMFEAAYFCEVIRAGIQSVRSGQINAAVALGMTYGQTMRYVVLPQAFRNMLPLFLTKSIIIFQDTSLVYVISLNDFLGVASKIGQRDSRLVELYLFAGAVYFVISFAASQLVNRHLIQKRT
ncbi:ABC transporter permease subunit [Aminobacter sp. Piv2-1]|uniref:ABC transporter permease subunit n=1 Tax=Aminobacter sp. Piv2-1 TaxID=3031122 RepID=UPI0030A19240